MAEPTGVTAPSDDSGSAPNVCAAAAATATAVPGCVRTAAPTSSAAAVGGGSALSPQHAFTALLTSTPLYALLPPSAKVVVFDVTIPLNIVFFAFVEHGECGLFMSFCRSCCVLLRGVVSLPLHPFLCYIFSFGCVSVRWAVSRTRRCAAVGF